LLGNKNFNLCNIKSALKFCLALLDFGLFINEAEMYPREFLVSILSNVGEIGLHNFIVFAILAI
jgi:hypothetical protein